MLTDLQQEHMRKIAKEFNIKIDLCHIVTGGAREFQTQDGEIQVKWRRTKFLGGGIFLYDFFDIYVYGKRIRTFDNIGDTWDVVYPLFCRKYHKKMVRKNDNKNQNQQFCNKRESNQQDSSNKKSQPSL